MDTEQKDAKSRKFISGVVEGFYGTPWKLSQREDLFLKLKKWNMNTYVYAPKDDQKHRKLWRDKYLLLEKKTIKRLITSAQTNCIEFIYAISPGIDIVFSSPKDVKHLKDKLRQVYKLGCRSFALLFDDINPELCLVDKADFLSSAEAQTHITNMMFDEFQDLNLMLFCPTEYCARRAKPNVSESEYLQTLGNKLQQNIQVLWTGPKVISKDITSEQLQEIARILKRKPLIWENLHANDYDHRHVFFGPFKGRPLEIYNEISGILTNPNCEYECNYIAIHSLGHWLQYASKSDQLEYNLNVGLDCAVSDWLDEMNIPRNVYQKSSKLNAKYGVQWDLNSLIDIDDLEDLLNVDEGDNDMMSESESESDINKHNTTEEDPIDIDCDIKKKHSTSELTKEDLFLLCDLFYLPYEYGPIGEKFVSDFKWLKDNALDHSKALSHEEINTWCNRSDEFIKACHQVEDMYARLVEIPNRCILKELHSYIYDVKEVVNKIASYVKYIGSKEREIGKPFFSTDPEAYSYKSGILFALEKLVSSFYRKLMEEQLSLNEHPDLEADIAVGAYIKYSRDLVFVLLVDDTIQGIVAASRNAKEFHDMCAREWLPMLRERYSSPKTCEEFKMARIPTMMSQSSDVYKKHKAVFTFHLSVNVTSPTILRSMVNVVSTMVQCSMFTTIPTKDVAKYRNMLTQANIKPIPGHSHPEMTLFSYG